MKFILALASIVILQACSETPSGSELSGYISLPDDRWSINPIPVCFEQIDGYSKDKETVRDAVNKEFAKAGIKFSNWGGCGQDDEGIRIRFVKEATISHTADFGSRINGTFGGMILALNPECSHTFTGSHCQANYALHEFGHALGMHHEMNRRSKTSCGKHDQTGGIGEADAIQVGDFDPLSIMSYCRLYEANRTGQWLSISQGDIDTLKERFHGIIATVNPKVPLVISGDSYFDVKGQNLVSYKYQLGSKGGLDCQDESAYGSIKSAEEKLLIPGIPSSHEKRLCILAKNAEGRWQSLENYTSVDFFVTAAYSNEKPSLKSEIEYPSHLKVGHDLSIKVKINHKFPLKKISMSLEAQEQGRSFQRIYNNPLKTKKLSEFCYEIIFDRDNFSINGTLIATSLDIVDVHGNGLKLYNYSKKESFENSEMNAPEIQVFNGDNFEDYKMELRELDIFPNLKAGTTRTWRFKMDHPLGLDFSLVRLQLRHDSSYTFSITSSKIEKQNDGWYELSLNVPSYHLNGTYIVNNIYFKDIWNHSLSIYASHDKTIYSKSGLAVISSQMTGGISDENETKIESIELSSSSWNLGESQTIKLNISHNMMVRHKKKDRPMIVLKHSTSSDWRAKIYSYSSGIVAGKWHFDFPLDNSRPKGSYYIEEIRFTDITGRVHSYKGSSDGSGFSMDSSIKTPIIELGSL